MKPRLSVVVPAHRHTPALMQTLQSLEFQTCPDFEVLVVDNPGQIEIRRYVNTLGKNFRYLTSAKGVNHARQVGALACRADWCLFLDSDCELFDSLQIEKIISFSEVCPFSGFGGVYTPSQQSSYWGRGYHNIQLKWLSQGACLADQTKYLLGGFCCLRKTLFDKESFDTNIVFGGSETELFLRLFKKGFTFQVQPEFKVIHDLNISFYEFIRKAYAQGVGHKRLQERNLLNTNQAGLDFRVYPAQTHFSVANFIFTFFFHLASESWSYPFRLFRNWLTGLIYRRWLTAIRALRLWQNLLLNQDHDNRHP